jgi:hypothetical protein
MSTGKVAHAANWTPKLRQEQEKLDGDVEAYQNAQSGFRGPKQLQEEAAAAARFQAAYNADAATFTKDWHKAGNTGTGPVPLLNPPPVNGELSQGIGIKQMETKHLAATPPPGPTPNPGGDENKELAPTPVPVSVGGRRIIP